MNEQVKISTARRIHDSLLRLPWSGLGMGLDWSKIEYFSVDLSCVGELSWTERREPVFGHEHVVLLASASSPAVLTSTADGFARFDEILSGPGFVLGADASEDVVDIHVADFAYYDGADHVFVACGDPLTGEPVAASTSSLDEPYPDGGSTRAGS